MFLAKLSVKRPVLTAAIIIVFLVLGWKSYQRLALEYLPEIDYPLITVQTVYPGAGPKEVESQVTEKIEDEVATLADLKHLTSQSVEGLSIVIAEFELGVDTDLKAIEVKDKVDAILFQLPDDAEKPNIQKLDVNATPIIELAVSGTRSLADTFIICDTTIKDRLAQASGVGRVELVGGQRREIQVAVNRDLANAYGLTLSGIANQITSENLDIPGGRIIENQDEFSLRMAGKFENLDQIRELTIPLPSGKTIRLKDVAQVVDGFLEPRSSARFAARGENDGNISVLKPSVNIQVIKKTGANTVSTANAVKSVLNDLSQELPADFQIEVVSDNSTYIRESADSTVNNIIVGVLLTAFLLFIFLHNTRATIIVAVTMPAAIIATFLLIDFAGFTLNMISLMALGVAIGTLVTNAIIVLENIIRHLQLGKEPADAAIDGTTEIAVAVIAGTLTNVVVFTPIAFMSGIIGIVFKQFGLTVVYATLYSLLMSFTIIPMMASLLLRKIDERSVKLHWFGRTFDKLLGVLQTDYRRSLQWSLNHRSWVVVGAVILFFGGIYLFSFIGAEFIPNGDEGLATLRLKLPAGTSLAYTEKILIEIENVIRENTPELRKVGMTVGGSGIGVEEGQLVLDFGKAENRQRSINDIVNNLRSHLGGIPDAEITVQARSSSRSSKEGDLVVELSGHNLDALKSAARRIEGVMGKVNGLVDVHTDIQEGKPEYTFQPDREQIARFGLTSAQIGMLIRTSYEGVKTSRYRDQGEEFDIRLQLTQTDRENRHSLDELVVQTSQGAIPLTQLGRFVLKEADSKINRKNKMRVISVFGNISQGVLGDLEKSVDQQIKALGLEDVKVNFGGRSEIMAESFRSILSALILAILLTYLVLAAIQESIVHPFTIMTTLPLGAIGASMALFLGNTTLNMMSLMALVMLVGIVVNNAILIIEQAALLRGQGKNLKEVLLEACQVRLRPILMMNLAIVISILPQAMGGSGSEFRKAMAVVTMGGVLVSTVFTLYLLPPLYMIFDRITVRGRHEKRETGE